MKNQGKTLEPLARKLRKASEGDAAADAKSRLRLLSDEVVRVVASYLPAVETPGVVIRRTARVVVMDKAVCEEGVV